MTAEAISMVKYPSLIIAAASVIAVGIFLRLGKPTGYKLDLKCYFRDAQGLRAGARVRVAGVEVGSVTNVRVRPELREHPAEVTMTLYTPYELKIPSDSTVSVETSGVMGDVFAQINMQDTSGPPLESGGVLNSRASDSPTPQQWVECLSNLVDHKPCDLTSRGAPASSAPAAPARH
jgi:phospholipid/cholesterol/gamma-HCH transport system substrate-binding protein